MKYRKGVAGESNDDDGSTKRGRDATPSIQVEIAEYHGGGGGGGGGGLGNGGSGSASFFEPWREATPGSGSGHGSSGRGGGGREPPEKRLTLFALRLAVLEKAASGLGMLDFMWATVVLLGGFASALRITDFWCVTVILVGEGARVFGRSHELEWQHHFTLTSTAGSRAALQLTALPPPSCTRSPTRPPPPSPAALAARTRATGRRSSSARSSPS
uniref:Uncharacterized protein n=1 Tax=Oryza glaberrima TaxID=4538 RepID=I1PBH7_ORYGL